MNTPERSAAIKRALESEPVGLPRSFAAQIAALASTQRMRRWSWSDAALLVAFAAMLGVCVAGWLPLGMLEVGRAEWLAPLARLAASHPWLCIGVAGLAVVQGLTFRRRVGIDQL
jgi:hypothetical protein